MEFPATFGPRNPRNSIKARIISDGQDQFFSTDEVGVYWPLMPEHVAVPVKPGEHVYVLFEDPDSEHGLWFGKVPGHEDVNDFAGRRSFSPDSRLSHSFPDVRPSSDDGALQTEEAASERLASDRLSSLWDV